MNTETMKNFVSQLVGSKMDMSKIENLLELSSKAVGLIQKGMKTTDAAEKQALQEEIMQCQKDLTREYDKLLLEMGLNKEDIEKFASNPNNLSQLQTKMIEAFKEKISTPEKEPRRKKGRIEAFRMHA